jgi:hypothetical protein
MSPDPGPNGTAERWHRVLAPRDLSEWRAKPGTCDGTTITVADYDGPSHALDSGYSHQKGVTAYEHV